MSDLVSIVIPTHNRGALLREALESALAQTHVNWEAIVVDDRSTDDTDAVMAEYLTRDARITYHKLPAGRTGGPAGRNLGAEKSTGDFVIFFDSDDLIAPDCLAHRAALMVAKPELDFAVWQCQVFRQTPGDTNLLWNRFTDATPAEDLDRYLRRDTVWQTTSPIWRRAALDKLGPWDESIQSSQDWEHHIRALARGLKYEKIDVVDCYWRRPDGERHSIGKSSFGVEHARTRVSTLDSVYRTVDGAGLMTPARKLWFAGLYFNAAERLARRVDRREGRALLGALRRRGILGPRRYAEGMLYFTAMHRHPWERRVKEHLLRRWPRELFAPGSPTFQSEPLDPAVAPSISVLLCVRNGEAYLDETLESILRQTEHDFEFVIVDNASTDGTAAILRRAADQDSRLRLMRSDATSLAGGLNDGLAACRGEFVARIDADDVCTHDRLHKQLAHLRAHPEVVALGSRIRRIDPLGAELDVPEHPLDHDAIDAQLLQGIGWSIVHPAAMMRRSAMLAVGGYDPSLTYGEDLDFFLKLAEIGRLANLPDVLLNYRQHLSSMGQRRTAEQSATLRRAVQAAHRRRGLTAPPETALADRKPLLLPAEQYRRWGWSALRLGKKRIARRHATAAVRTSPWSPESWRMLYCALRGR